MACGRIRVMQKFLDETLNFAKISPLWCQSTFSYRIINILLSASASVLVTHILVYPYVRPVLACFQGIRKFHHTIHMIITLTISEISGGIGIYFFLSKCAQIMMVNKKYGPWVFKVLNLICLSLWIEPLLNFKGLIRLCSWKDNTALRHPKDESLVDNCKKQFVHWSIKNILKVFKELVENSSPLSQLYLSSLSLGEKGYIRIKIAKKK